MFLVHLGKWVDRGWVPSAPPLFQIYPIPFTLFPLPYWHVPSTPQEKIVSRALVARVATNKLWISEFSETDQLTQLQQKLIRSQIQLKKQIQKNFDKFLHKFLELDQFYTNNLTHKKVDRASSKNVISTCKHEMQC